MIHWQYIKGAYNQPYSGTTDNTTLYTFLDYYGGVTMPDTLTQSMLPTIEICNNTDRNASGVIRKLAEHIVTSGNIAQQLAGLITFNGALESNLFYDIPNQARPTHREILWAGDSNNTPIVNIGHDFRNVTILDWIAVFSRNAANTDGSVIIGVGTQINGTLDVQKDISSDTDIYAARLCQAQYFNATSDRRAKTDIKPINQPVLPLVTNTQLYSFKYKDLDTPSIGIIAQDVQDVDFDGFSLVDNKEATGQDMDYMSIHESKLIYVLWKAVQEQQKEIEELKAQIKKGL